MALGGGIVVGGWSLQSRRPSRVSAGAVPTAVPTGGATTNSGATSPTDPASPARPPVTRLHAPGAVVAIGDLHGDPPAALAVLRMAGLVNDRGGWIGGTTWLVQTGDILDRGPDSRGMIVLLHRLEVEAQAAGGRVIALNGNHEVMNLRGDWRYVSPEDLAGYGGEVARKAAYLPSGPDGDWILDHDIVAQVDDTVFAHGGIDAHWAGFGVNGLNAMARAAMTGRGPLDVLGPDGPLWNRVYLQASEVVACPELSKALVSLGAARMVVGHTTQESGRVAERCGGQLYGIDVGISAHYGSHLGALRIEDNAVRALYPIANPTPRAAPTTGPTSGG